MQKRVAVTVDPNVSEGFLEDLRELVSSFPGEHELVVTIGERTLVLGPAFRVSGCSALRSDLGALAGVAFSERTPV